MKEVFYISILLCEKNYFEENTGGEKLLLFFIIYNILNIIELDKCIEV